MPAPDTHASGDVLLVLGMHRSGTSLVSGLLNSAGMNLGHTLMEPAADNPKGFWENQPIADLHERLLNSFDQSWSSYGSLPDDWLETTAAQSCKRDLASLLDEEFDSWERLCIKDPRLCRLLPLWRALCDDLGLALRCVSVIRPAADVAASLASRDGLSPAHGQALWLRYNLDWQENATDLPVLRTSYQQWLEDATGTMAAVGELCGYPLEPDQAAVDPSLHHHHSPESDGALDEVYRALAAGDAPLPAWISGSLLPMQEQLAELEKQLAMQAAGDISETELASAREQTLFEEAQDAKRYAGSIERELQTGREYIDAMEEELAERQRYAANLEQELAARDSDIETRARFVESLEAELTKREQYAASLKTSLQERETYNESLQATLTEHKAELAERQAYLDSLLQAREAEQKESQAYIESLQSELKKEQTALGESLAALQQERAGHEEFVAAHNADVAEREAHAQALQSRINDLETRFRYLIKLGSFLTRKS